MTSYFDVTKGQSEQLDRLLAQAGMTLEDVKNVLAKPELAAKMVAGLRTASVQV
jgi:ABC-type nitrate/sulfonate/bicarbonate transport system substrate-binding protein